MNRNAGRDRKGLPPWRVMCAPGLLAGRDSGLWLSERRRDAAVDILLDVSSTLAAVPVGAGSRTLYRSCNWQANWQRAPSSAECQPRPGSTTAPAPPYAIQWVTTIQTRPTKFDGTGPALPHVFQLDRKQLSGSHMILNPKSQLAGVAF